MSTEENQRVNLLNVIYKHLQEAKEILSTAREEAERLRKNMNDEKGKTGLSYEFFKKQDEYEKLEIVVDDIREYVYKIEDVFKELLLENNK